MRKSNYLAAAMAFAAIVGCQKELAPVVGTEQAGDAGLDQRPVLANTELTIGGPETRAEAGQASGIGWGWESGDQVGAMIVDQIETSVTLWAKVNGAAQSKDWSYADYVKGSKMYGNTEVKLANTFTDEDCTVKTTSKAFYKVIDEQVWTNYPYTTEDKKHFTTPATLVEGHYMFYAPYNENNGKRGPLVATLPVNQKVGENGNEAVDAFYKGENPAILTVNYLSAEETSTVSPTPGHIFAYPQFTIKNKFNGYLFDGTTAEESGTYLSTANKAQTFTMKLKSMELYVGKIEEKALLAYQRKIVPSKVYAAVEADKWVLPSESKILQSDDYRNAYYNLASTEAVTTVDVANAFTNNMLNAMQPNLAVKKTELQKPEQRIVVDLGGYELAYGKEYKFNVVMPAADYTEGGLNARLCVEIGGKDYYIVTNETTYSNGRFGYKEDATVIEKATSSNYSGYAKIKKDGLGDVADYQFADRHDRGSYKIVLARGQRWPAAEINADNTAKNFKGELLTIELVGGLAQAAIAVAEGPAPKKGIETTPDLIDFLNGIQNDADVTEVNDETEVDDYKHFFVVPENELVINADLIHALVVKNAKGSFTLIKNYPIADDVTVKDLGDNTFEFTSKTNEKDVYKITYQASFNTTANALTEGINVVNGGELKAGTNVKNAVVFVSGTATVKTPAGIMGIVVNANATLNVEATADVTAWIVAADDSFINLKGTSKGLTNTTNKFGTATFTNQALATIAGEVKGKVSYVTDGGFGTERIAAATKINDVTIYSAQKFDKDPKEVAQADFDFYKDLSNVTYHFHANYAGGFRSKANITVANAVKIEYMGEKAVKWSAPVQDTKVTIKGGTTTKPTEFVKIEPGTGVTLVNKGETLTSDMVFNFEEMTEAATTGDVTLGANISKNLENDGIALKMQAGKTLDGNGKTLMANGLGEKNHRTAAVKSEGGKITDLTVDGAFRNIDARGLTANLTLEGVISGSEESESAYAINVSGTDVKLSATRCEFYGWSSWNVGDNNAEFVNCYFGGTTTQCAIAPWGTTTFENCTFEQGLAWNFDKEGSNVRMNGTGVTMKQVIKLKNCFVGETKITKDNFREIFYNGYQESKSEAGKWSNSFFTVWLDPTAHFPTDRTKTIEYFFEVVE